MRLMRMSVCCFGLALLVNSCRNDDAQPYRQLYGAWTSLDRDYISGVEITRDSITFNGPVFTVGFGATSYVIENDSTIIIDMTNNSFNTNRTFYFNTLHVDTLYWSEVPFDANDQPGFSTYSRLD